MAANPIYYCASAHLQGYRPSFLQEEMHKAKCWVWGGLGCWIQVKRNIPDQVFGLDVSMLHTNLTPMLLSQNCLQIQNMQKKRGKILRLHPEKCDYWSQTQNQGFGFGTFRPHAMSSWKYGSGQLGPTFCEQHICLSHQGLNQTTWGRNMDCALGLGQTGPQTLFLASKVVKTTDWAQTALVLAIPKTGVDVIHGVVLLIWPNRKDVKGGLEISEFFVPLLTPF